MAGLIPWRRAAGGWLEQMRHEMDEMFQRFAGEAEFGTGKRLMEWAPRIDVEETDKEIVVKADLPGVDPKDVEVTVRDNALVIRGEKKEEKEEKRKNYHRVERFAGQFFRAIPLPAGADAEKVSATGAKGVVTVTIPKAPGALPKKVPVKPQD
jgi:HSP20 family protein